VELPTQTGGEPALLGIGQGWNGGAHEQPAVDPTGQVLPHQEADAPGEGEGAVALCGNGEAH
jgi:hypothetical protein